MNCGCGEDQTDREDKKLTSIQENRKEKSSLVNCFLPTSLSYSLYLRSERQIILNLKKMLEIRNECSTCLEIYCEMGNISKTQLYGWHQRHRVPRIAYMAACHISLVDFISLSNYIKPYF